MRLEKKPWLLLKLLVHRELKLKYRGSVLGYLWSMLNPLFFMIIISLVFSRLIRGIENYDIFVLSGILFWNMTAHSLTGGTSSFVNNAGLLMKVKTPIWVFALVPLGSALTNLVLALIPYTIFVLFKGVMIPWTVVFLPVVLFLYALFLAGLSLVLSTMNVFFRDVAHVLEPLIQLAFYATPIIYDRQHPMIPESIRMIIGLNPFTQFVEMFRQTIFRFDAFHYHFLISISVLAVISLALGLTVFQKKRAMIAFKL
ncbi:MAG: ABC transporter permease [Deltaproteobacteria bacterium]|nr:ABC transporter permease [Deltaproteobacteria bacterium]